MGVFVFQCIIYLIFLILSLLLSILFVIYIMVLFLDIYIQMEHLLHFLLLILTLLDLLGSSNPLGSINTNNKVTFFSYILNKDIYGFLILFTLYCMQLGYGLLLVSHPDNALEVNILVTPF